MDDGIENLRRAAEAIRNASALLIGAGAGMGVDSGLPDFRGNEGFWKAYPPFRGRQFAEMSNPYWFRTDPSLAWGSLVIVGIFIDLPYRTMALRFYGDGNNDSRWTRLSLRRTSTASFRKRALIRMP